MCAPENTPPLLCVLLSYSLLRSMQPRSEFHPLECHEDFPLGWLEAERTRFLIAARSSSITYPHTLNYGAFARELRRVGCTHVVSSAVCGALGPNAVVPSMVIPDQFIDMHRVATVDHRVAGEEIRFDDFSSPFCQGLRLQAFSYLNSQGRCPVSSTGCYVGVDGPRYETAAEVRAYRILGGDVVGMTAVREATASRQAGLCFATIALVTNHGAGLGNGTISYDEIRRTAAKFGDLFFDCGRHLATQLTTCDCDCR